MNEKNILKEKLKELFSLSKKMSFFDVKLKDGSILRTADEAINKGSQLTLIGADGIEVAPTDGDHTTEDGSVINIKGGVCDSITPASPAIANEKMDATTTTDSTSTPAPVAESPAVETSEDANMSQLMEIVKNLVERIAALEAGSADTKMTVEKMAAMPASKPFNKGPLDDNSIFSVLEKFKADKKEKESKRKEAFEKVMSDKTTENFKAETTNMKKPVETKKNDFTFNLGGGLSISSGN